MRTPEVVEKYNICVQTILITELSRKCIDAVLKDQDLQKYEYWSLECDLAIQNIDEVLWDEIVKWINKTQTIKKIEPREGVKERISIIGVCIDNANIDLDDMIYLLTFLYHLKSPCKVCFYTNKYADYNYFKLGALLTLWLAQTGKQNDVKYYNPNNRSYKSKNGKNSNSTLKKFAYEFGTNKGKSKGSEFSTSAKFFPIVEIDSSIYGVLDEEYDSEREYNISELLIHLSANLSSEDKKKAKADYFRAYAYEFIKKMYRDVVKAKNSSKLCEMMAKFYKTKPQLLVAILYSRIISEQIDEENKKDKNEGSLEERGDRLVENCFAYAQGVMQLIENAKIHVVENLEYNSSGKALFGFFIDNYDKIKPHCNQNLFIGKDNSTEKGEQDSEDTARLIDEIKEGYFLRFTITDCIVQAEDRVRIGIVERFNDALTAGISGSSDDEEKIKSLTEIFDYPNCKSPTLDKYYHVVSNVANHYGLQIFDNVVTANSGLFTVESGRGSEKSFYSNATKTGFAHEPLYVKNEGSYNNFNGTECFILIPIIQSNDIEIGNMSLGNESIDYSAIYSARGEKTAAYPDIKEKITLAADSTDVNYFADQMKCDCEIAHFSMERIANRKQLEIACKAAVMTLANSEENEKLKVIVLTDFRDENELLNAVRIISLFYDKAGNCNFMQTEDGVEKGIFLYCFRQGARDIELYFHGKGINAAMENIERQKMLKQVPNSFYRHIKCALSLRGNTKKLVDKSGDNCFPDYHCNDQKTAYNNLFVPAVYLKYALCCDESRTIAQYQLQEILNEDIHSDNLGCKIADTHMRIGDVHLNTFFEAQFLFGNAYWTDVFALYVSDRIIKNGMLKIGEKRQRLILYGYEIYSSMLLHKVAQILEKNFDVDIYIYEKKEERIRKIKASDGSICTDAMVVYVVGISSTLSTFMQMNNALEKKEFKFAINRRNCISVIQVAGPGSESFIYKSNNDRSYTSKLGYLDFADEPKQADCFVAVEAEWSNVGGSSGSASCAMCMPNNYLDENSLIEVDETSVVPTQMIFLNNAPKSKWNPPFRNGEKTRATEFLTDGHNAQYLYYGHIVRNNNHFQYYIRNSALYRDKRTDIEKWLENLRGALTAPKICYIDNQANAKVVEIIIAPQHFSNTGFANSVNKCVFGSRAHIIEFDIRKEYRSNFKAKYSNYKQLGEFLSGAEGYIINFYYVNDQIISGNTFHRAKSLVKGLLSVEDAATKRNKINIFKGVFVLTDRNSDSTQLSFVEKAKAEQGDFIPFFSYIRFDIPSLRNHDDSCPICNQSSAMRKIIDCSVFNSTALHFQKKVIKHREKTVSQVFSEQSNDVLDGNSFDRIDAFRKMGCENELWKCIKSINMGKDKSILVYHDVMEEKLFGPQSGDMLIAQDGSPLSAKKRIDDLPPEQKRDLFKMVISRLCSIGSCALLNKDRLDRCRAVGAALFSVKITKCEPADLNDYGEKLIDYIKIISSPLLFYRERIKSATLKLLLEILNIYLYPEWTGSEPLASQNSTNSEFDEFLLCNLKKLLWYDKGVSKAKACDNALKEGEVISYSKDGSAVISDDFYRMLYLENNRVDINKKDLCSNKPIFPKNENNDEDDYRKITERYDYAVKQIKANIGSEDECKIAIFAQVPKHIKSSQYTYIAGDKEILAPTDYATNYIYDKDGCIHYINIGNNYEKINGNAEILGLTKSSKIWLGVKTSSLYTLRKILTYRKEILEEIERDANIKAVQALIEADFLLAALTETKALTHGSSPYSGYGELIDAAVKNVGDIVSTDMPSLVLSEELISAISSMFISTFISHSYRDLVKRAIRGYDDNGSKNEIDVRLEKDGDPYLLFTASTITASDYMMGYFCPQGWITQSNVAENILFCATMIKDRWGKDINFEVNFEYKRDAYTDEEPLQLLDCDERTLRRLFSEEYAMRTMVQDLTPYTYFSLYMLVNLFLNNVKKHNDGHVRACVRLVKNSFGGVDLTVINNIEQSTKMLTDKKRKPGITLVALANFFGYEDDNDSETRIKWQETETEFSVSVKNIIVKE